jgi:RND family efflux transporter MFP subunit
MSRTTVALLIATLAMAGCNKREAIQQPPQAVLAQKVDGQSSASSGLRFSAVVTPDMEVPLAFRVPGYVISVKQARGQDGRMREIAEGDHIGRGSVLVRIRASEYQDKVHQASSQVEAAEAAATKAKLDYERATRLFAVQSITKPEMDSAQAQYDATQAEIRAARAQTSESEVALGDTSLVAPFDGDIVKKSVDLGAFVGPGTPVFTLANTDTVKILVGVPDLTVRSIKLGRRVQVEIDAFPNRKFPAHISRVASSADSVTKNFDVEVAVANREHLLKPGMIGSLHVASDTAPEQQASLRVPLSAIVQSPDGNYGVFMVSQSNGATVARLRTIAIGPVAGTDVTIISGLSADESIITSGANLLKDGQRVEVLQ